MGDNKFKYGEIVKKIQDSSCKYWAVYSEYKELLNKKSDLDKKIDCIKKEVKQLGDDIELSNQQKLDGVSRLVSDCNKEILKNINEFKSQKTVINSQKNKYKNAVADIENRYSNIISEKFDEIDRAEREIEHLKENIDVINNKCQDFDNQINDLAEEDNQIKLCISHISSSYENIHNNVELMEECHNKIGQNLLADSESLINGMDYRKIEYIAKKLNSGHYISSPSESGGIPIGDIMLLAFDKISIVFGYLLFAVKLLYGHRQNFRDLWKRVVYCLAVSVAILWCFAFAISKFGKNLIGLLLVLLGIFCVLFFAMLVINLVRYGSIAARRSMNREYFAVGYCFVNDRDFILYKLASFYYESLKKNDIATLESMIGNQVIALNNSREEFVEELKKQDNILKEVKYNLDRKREVYIGEKERLKVQCEEEKKSMLEELNRKIKLQIESIRNEFDDKNLQIIEETDRQELKIYRGVSEEINIIENSIEEKNSNREIYIREREDIKKSLKRKKSECRELLSYNNAEVGKIYGNESEVRVIENRENKKNDIFPNALYVGINGQCIDTNEIEVSNGIKLYDMSKIVHNDGPIIITYSCREEEKEMKSIFKEKYYSMIDSLIYDLLDRIYVGSFKCVISDSKSSEKSIIESMVLLKPDIEGLKRRDNIEIYDNISIEQCFDKIIYNREQEIKRYGDIAMNIGEINEKNSRSNKMIRTIILSIRLYSNNSCDSLEKLIKQIDKCLNIGIIPLIFISDNYFDKNVKYLEVIMGNYHNYEYYHLFTESNELREKEVVLEKKCIK